ncbi:MAG: hypothetical protein GX297_05620 [Treponema sp.]|nr:hypothetical protein [Treponema sp.]
MIDSDAVNAKFANKVLTVTIPHKKKQDVKTILINAKEQDFILAFTKC